MITSVLRRAAPGVSISPGCGCVGRAPANDTPIQRCTILTLGGAYLTEGLAEVIESGHVVEVCLTNLTDPGALLVVHIERGARRFLLAFEEGHTLTAELAATVWHRQGHRLCRFVPLPASPR